MERACNQRLAYNAIIAASPHTSCAPISYGAHAHRARAASRVSHLPPAIASQAATQKLSRRKTHARARGRAEERALPYRSPLAIRIRLSACFAAPPRACCRGLSILNACIIFCLWHQCRASRLCASSTLSHFPSLQHKRKKKDEVSFFLRSITLFSFCASNIGLFGAYRALSHQRAIASSREQRRARIS